MQRSSQISPPKHRHDGTSPLPLGLDWSPPPRSWNGNDTIWPHDFHTGWSYCVTIPSWVVFPKSRNSDPVVFYRVQIGIQSPEGITTVRVILRRFNDFMNLFSDLKKAFPKKNLPASPPKGLLRMKTRALLEERKYSLEQWMTKLLSDIHVSRSVVLASFLELEAAVRSVFQDTGRKNPEIIPSTSSSTGSSLQLNPNSILSMVNGKTSIASDFGSDTAYEASELGSPWIEKDSNSEAGTDDLSFDEDLTKRLMKYGIDNIDEGLFMGQTILDQLEGSSRNKVHTRQVNSHTVKNIDNGNVDKVTNLSNVERGIIGHVRKLSTESDGSDILSLKGSDMTNSGIVNSIGNGLDYPKSSEVLKTMEITGNRELQFAGDTQLVLPLDQQKKLNRVLMTMQRRLVTAKTDMEDLVARLDQEIAVKDYLMTKVKDLEVELEATKQKNKENMQHAISCERERVTQMKWDMEELRRKSLEMEWKLKSEKDENLHLKPVEVFSSQEKDELLNELDAAKKQLKNVIKKREELETKSKSDIKVLVKEVKSLRGFQADLKQQLSQSLNENAEAEIHFQEERRRKEHANFACKRLLQECSSLRSQLQECDIDILLRDEDKILSDYPPQSDALLDLLATSDKQIDLLLSQAHLFPEEETSQAGPRHEVHDPNGDATLIEDDNCDYNSHNNEIGKMMKLLLLDNVGLRKQVNSVSRHALKSNAISKTDDDMEALSAKDATTTPLQEGECISFL